jgi:hypothetical protein
MRKTYFNQKLIIGSNSKIISQIANKLSNFDFVSHKNLGTINLQKYKHIFLFSWDSNLSSSYLNLINTLPLSKTIFISSISVFSLQIRNQWAKYPNNKKLIEDLISKNGGSIIRIGIWGDFNLNRYFNFVPFTPEDKLIECLNSWESSNIIINLFTIIDCRKGSFLKIFFKKLYYFSFLFPGIKLFQAPIALIPKIFLFKSYGYTADCCSIFSAETLIGFGCLGSSFKRKYNFSGNILVSNLPDFDLNINGFKNTKIGQERTGLSKYWHGVQVVEVTPGNYVKKVPFFVPRSKLISSAIPVHVTDIKYLDGGFIISYLNNGNIKYLFTDKIILGSGPINNILLILGMLGITDEVFCSDHEIGMIGTITLKECIDKKILSVFGPFIFGRRLFCNSEKYKYCLDFRPYVPEKHNIKSNFYNDSTSGIIYKLIKCFSLSRLNEAFFNKFGLAFKTAEISVFIQILNENCISISNSNVIRVRFTSSDWSKIASSIHDVFSSFTVDSNIDSFDGQHIVGGSSLLDSKILTDLIDSNKLVILGSPTTYKLNAFHHTVNLQNLI